MLEILRKQHDQVNDLVKAIIMATLKPNGSAKGTTDRPNKRRCTNLIGIREIAGGIRMPGESVLGADNLITWWLNTLYPTLPYPAKS